LAPLAACLVAAIGTYGAYVITHSIRSGVRDRGFRIGQIGSASLVSIAHGTNDAQKTMGVITLALVVNGTLQKGAGTPLWVVLACATSIALGTASGGFRVIRTLGKGLVDIESPQGFAAETSSTAVILASTHFGYPLSTTHVVTGSVVGSGIGKRLAHVRWSLAGRMAAAWIVTLPAAALVGALAWRGATLIGGVAGVIVLFVLAAVVAAVIAVAAHRAPVHASNVNDDWDADPSPDRRAEVDA
jgi:inorganic phosphate transporter, PiT family